MTIAKMIDGTLKVVKDSELDRAPYAIKIGSNGKKFVDRASVACSFLNVSSGNEKTGNALNLNFEIEYTCDHSCECYGTKACYACGGCYLYGSNLTKYSENVNFFLANSSADFINAVQIAINESGNVKLFRYFTCGDIINTRFLDCMVKIALNNPTIRFWTYTKKYGIVNRYIENGGVIPENLVILFSHWLNNDGTYFPMENPHKMPTSEFIPIGKEYLAETVTHICPCSDPNQIATCETCDHPCYLLKRGESMALLEHSTKASHKRDIELKTAKNALKATLKASK